jgi:hypothetical protein
MLPATILTPILWITLLFQDPVHRLDYWFLMTNAENDRETSDTQHRMKLQRQLVEKRYQKLLDALRHFATKYNDAQGGTLPLKEVEELRKAYRDFETSMLQP